MAGKGGGYDAATVTPLATRLRHAMKSPRDETAMSYELGFLALGLVVMGVLRRHELGIMPGAEVHEARSWAELSAWALTIFGVWMARDLGWRFDLLLDRLRARQALEATDEQLAAFKDLLRGKLRIAASLGGVALPAILLVAYLLGKEAAQYRGLLPFVIALELGAAFIVGRHAGRAVLYGYLGRLLRSNDLSLRLSPGHPDGAAGLKPIGDLYLFGAGLVLLPAIFFAFWWLVMAGWSTPWPSAARFAAEWMNTYLVFLCIALAVQCFAFVLPMLSFHEQMSAEKERFLAEADEIGCRVTELKATLVESLESKEIAQRNGEITRLTERAELLESLPEWPVDTSIRRRFAVRNLLVLTPGLVGTVGRAFPQLHDYLARLQG
jgi:hypothetical protein